MKPRIAILASGGGTTAEAVIRATQTKAVSYEAALVISSRDDKGLQQRIIGLNHELGLNIPYELVNQNNYPPAPGESLRRGYQTQAEEAAILRLLNNGNFDLVACLGYMKHVGASIVHEFGWRSEYVSMYQARMVNTHPGLLPDTAAFYGENIQKYVLEKGLPFGGQSLHLVSEEYDEGPLLAEHKVLVEPGDTAETLFARVQATEKQYLPHDIDDFLKARKAYLASSN